MNTLTDLESARRTVFELCREETSGLAAPQLLALLDAHIARARRNGDGWSANILQEVRKALRAKSDTLH